MENMRIGGQGSCDSNQTIRQGEFDWSCFTMVKCSLAGVILIIVGFISDSPRKLPHTWEKSITGNPAARISREAILMLSVWKDTTLWCLNPNRCWAHVWVKSRTVNAKSKHVIFGQKQNVKLWTTSMTHPRLSRKLCTIGKAALMGTTRYEHQKNLVSHGLLWRFFYEWILLKK